MPPKTNVIIAGTTRAGTTSLFLYLADHPSICRAVRKETRFFLDNNYPLERVASFESGYDAYAQLFEPCMQNPVWLEATPDYLHSPGTATRIAETLDDVHLVFLLRDPIERLQSWYQYAIQRGLIPETETLEHWIRQQLEREPSESTPQHERVLTQGRYSIDLQAYFGHFERQRLHVWSHSAFQREPRLYLQEICDAISVHSDFFQDYTLEQYNPSFQPRSVEFHLRYQRLSERIRAAVLGRRTFRRMLAGIKRPLDSIYRTMNAVHSSREGIPNDLHKQLEAYYDGEIQRLSELLGGKQWRW